MSRYHDQMDRQWRRQQRKVLWTVLWDHARALRLVKLTRAVLLMLSLACCTVEPVLRVPEQEPVVLVTIPPSPVRCYGMDSDQSGDGAEVFLDALTTEGSTARYAPDWPETNLWVLCPRPDIDNCCARCPTNLDGIDDHHWWDCFKITE